MSEAGHELELSDEQKEEVRKMLEQFSGKKEKQKQAAEVRKKDNKTSTDPLEVAQAGETVEWTELTPITRRYTIVRETRCHFIPLIMDKIPITGPELVTLALDIGMEISSQNAQLTVCAVDQADPIRVFHIQTKPCKTPPDTFIIETVRYVV